jgi:hypothetical protein
VPTYDASSGGNVQRLCCACRCQRFGLGGAERSGRFLGVRDDLIGADGVGTDAEEFGEREPLQE